MSIQYFAMAVIDDVPLEVEVQTERNEFINLKVIEKVADDDYGAVHAIDEDALVDDEAPGRGPTHCGNFCCRILCCKSKHKKKAAKSEGAGDIADFPAFDYPEQVSASGAWPKPLSKARDGAIPISARDQKAAAKAAAKAKTSYDTSSYVSAVSAVPAPAGVSGYSAVPPPPPSGYV